MPDPKPWSEQTIPEKIGTVIGTAIGIWIVASIVMAFIAGELTIAGIFTFLAEAFLWVIIGTIALIVIVCCFPGVLIVIIGAIVLLAVILIGCLVSGVVGLFA